jgi:3'-5' exoribonuclease
MTQLDFETGERRGTDAALPGAGLAGSRANGNRLNGGRRIGSNDGSPTPGTAVRTCTSALQPGTCIEQPYLVSSKELRTARNGKPYLKLRVGDREGMLDCMVWEGADRLAPEFETGDVVLIEARVGEYAGKVQLEATGLRRLLAGEYQAEEFLPQTYRDIDELQGFLRFHIESVYDEHLRALLESIFGDEEFLARFSKAPAAKQFHHAYLGGLLEHSVGVADLCDHIAQQYGRVNRDLLIAAALLHDVGKVDELTYSSSIDYSNAGRFLGHVILGITFVSGKAAEIPGFPEQKLQHLLHAIVSHHGELEWGSPKRPKTLEALIIHHVDNLDAKVKGFLEIVEGSRNAEWTDLRNLFRRPLHVPRAAHQEDGFLPVFEGPPGEL